MPQPGSAAEPKLVQESRFATSDLTSGARLTVTFTEPGYRLVEISQEFADVQLTLSVEQNVLGNWDAPARRAAPERAFAYTDAGVLSLTLTAAEASKSPDARVLVRIRSYDRPSTELDQRLIGAESLQSDAGLVLPEASNDVSATQVQVLAEARARKYQAAAALWERQGNPRRAAEAYLQAGWMLVRRTSMYVDAVAVGIKARGQFSAARDRQGEAFAAMQLAVPRWELADSGLDDKGAKLPDKNALLAMTARELEDAVAVFEAARRPFYSAEARGHLAYNYFQQGRFQEAMHSFGAAEALYRIAGEMEGVMRAQANMNIVVNQATDYRKASATFDRMLANVPPEAASAELADIFDNSALTHSAAGNYGKALPQFLRALLIHEQRADLVGMARSLNGLAATYMRLGLPSAALGYAQQSIELLRQRPGDKGRGSEWVEITSEMLAGNAQRALGDVSGATASHRAALSSARANDAARLRVHLELARDALAANDARTASAQIDLARGFRDPESALLPLQLDFESARASMTAGEIDAAFSQLQGLRGRFAAIGAREYEIELLDALARVQFRRGRIEDALASNGSALDLLRSLRLGVASPELRARLTASYRAGYELRVELLDSMRGRTSDRARKTGLLHQMFAASDQARAGLVHETTEARTLVSNDAAGESLRETAAEIALRENALAAIDTGGAPAANAAQLRADVAMLRAKYDALSPLVPARASFDARDYATGGMRRDTAILVYLDSTRQLRRFLVTRRGIDELPALEWNAAARKESAGKLLPDARTLAAYPHLLVVADPLLAPLPFAALTAGGASGVLAASHDVTMSLTLRDALRIAALDDPKRSANLSMVALFSDPVFTPYDKRVTRKIEQKVEFSVLEALPGTKAEADRIIARLPPRNVLNFTGLDATRLAALSPAVEKATALHFATHAVASDEWPNGSGLQLTAFTGDGVAMNGFVSTLDLLSRRASTDLVVLSACDTARGDAAPGENVAGLARAFLGGGARRVVASLWKVDDRFTADLMVEFYSQLASGRSPAIALNEAQRKMAGPGSAGQRPAWAAFVLYERAP